MHHNLNDLVGRKISQEGEGNVAESLAPFDLVNTQDTFRAERRKYIRWGYGKSKVK